MAFTYANVITDALQDLGVIQGGEAPSAEDQALGLNRLNRLIDQWKAENLQIPSITRTTWSITANDGSYTVGTGGDVNIARPNYVAIEHINIVDTNQTPDLEIPLEPMTDDAYAGIPIKSLTSTYPSQWWYNPTFPLGTLEFWPVPSGTGLLGAIYCLTALGEVAVTDDVSVPPAYRRMIETALAIECAPAFEKEPSPTLRQAAHMAMTVVKRSNIKMSDLSIDAGALGAEWSRYNRWSIYTGP